MNDKNNYLFKNVASQFLVFIIPAMVISLLIFGTVFYFSIKRQELDKHRASSQILTEKTNMALKQWIDAQINKAKTIAEDERVLQLCLNPKDNDVREKAQSFLQSIHNRYGIYENIPVAIKLEKNTSFNLSIKNQNIEIKNANFIIDTVDGRTIGGCSPDFSYIPPIFEQKKDYYISEVYPSILQGDPIFVISVPVKNSDNDVIGAVIVAPRIDKFTDMFISDSKIGNTGYLFMIDDRSIPISHPLSNLILNDEAKSKFNFLINNIKSGLNDFVDYFDNTKRIYNVSGLNDNYNYNIRYNWYVVSSLEYSEILSHANSMLVIIVLCIIVLTVFITLLIIKLTEKIITNPLTRLKSITDKIACGDLTEDILPEVRKNEITSLNHALNNMTANLRKQTLIIFKSVSMLEDSSLFINQSMEDQQSIVQNNKKAASEIASAVCEITSTSKELAATMQNVQNTAKSTESFADASKLSLKTLEETINQLENSTFSISEQLNVIKEKAANIGLVITTISKIANHTNLLSLNASIEAEKAGEAGRGFMVVSREIRRLADQTAVSTLNIERIVKEMQNSVSTGVSEMEKFAQDVKKSIEIAEEAGTQISETINQVKELTPQFAYVNEGMHAQFAGAEEINISMQQLNDDTEKTVTALEQITNASEHLQIASNNLKKEVNKFKV